MTWWKSLQSPLLFVLEQNKQNSFPHHSNIVYHVIPMSVDPEWTWKLFLQGILNLTWMSKTRMTLLDLRNIQFMLLFNNIQYCAKVMQAKFGEFCSLFSRIFERKVSLPNDISSEISRKYHLILQKGKRKIAISKIRRSEISHGN